MHRFLTLFLVFGTFSTLPAPVRAPVPLPPIAPPVGVLSLEEIDGLSASGILVLDLDSGQRIAGRDVSISRPMASLAKIMTALLLIERGELDEPVSVPPDVGTVGGMTVGLQAGQRYAKTDLLAALLLASGNDAAYTLALHHSDTIPSFVRAMNIRARVLGLKQTRFQNPSGLDAVGQESTPDDLARLTAYVLRYPVFREIVGSVSWKLTPVGGGPLLVAVNTNRLLHAQSRSSPALVSGVKTGTTVAAGECLISLAQLHGREVLIVLLKSSHRYRDAHILLRELSQFLA